MNFVDVKELKDVLLLLQKRYKVLAYSLSRYVWT